MITADIQGLRPGDYVQLFELDYSMLGGEVMLFHGYESAGPIVWKGQEYSPWAIEAKGFGKVGNGQQPTPTLSVGNIRMDDQGNSVAGVITALCLLFGDLRGAKLTRVTTLAQYLDAVNFPEGNPSASPDEEFPREIWTVEAKVHEEASYVEFELKSALDFNEVMLPNRRIITICSWLEKGGYRGPYCNYTGPGMFDMAGNPVTDPTKDKCSGLVKHCKLRFGEFEELNHGGCPAADAVRGY